MRHLRTGSGAVTVNRIREHPQAWYDAGLELQLVLEGTAIGTDSAVCNRRHTDTAGSNVRVVFHEHLRRNAPARHALVGR
jgi:hypothetical protein